MFFVEETAMNTPSEYTPGSTSEPQHLAIPAPSGYYVQSTSRAFDRWPWVAVALIVAIAAVAVAFMLTIGKEQNTSTIRPVAAAAHHAPATKVITRTVAGPSTTVIREEASSSSAPAGSGSCGGISLNADTSCPFAQNVVDEYDQQAQDAGGPGSFAVYAYSPVTGQNYTDACTYSGGTVSCSHGSDLIQFSYGDAAQPAASTQYCGCSPQSSGSTSDASSCSGISINASTSCPFAQNVVNEYMGQAGAGSPGSLDVQAYSPVTGKNYTDTCTYTSSDDMVSCSHGSDQIQFAYSSH
jgi:hypothetical protein